MCCKSHHMTVSKSLTRLLDEQCICLRSLSVYQLSFILTGYKGNRYTSAQSTTSAYKVDYSQPHSYSDKPVYNRYQSHGYLEPNYYNRRSRSARSRRTAAQYGNPPFPWYKVKQLAQSLHWAN